MQSVLDFITNIDSELQQAVQNHGGLIYLICFFIIFAETGLLIFGILPGDSLLFTAGSLAGSGIMEPALVFAIFPIAALIGDQTNYGLGHLIGRSLFKRKIPFLSEKNLKRAEGFYDKHGAKTIIFGRYVPFIRTLIPFSAAVLGLSYGRFIKYSIIGAPVWALTFLVTGYFFGQIKFVKENFWLVIVVVVVLSLIPAIYELIKLKKEK